MAVLKHIISGSPATAAATAIKVKLQTKGVSIDAERKSFKFGDDISTDPLSG